MKKVIGVVNNVIAKRYAIMDNFTLLGDMPELFTIHMEDSIISVTPFIPEDKFFDKISEDLIGKVIRFNTKNVVIYGTDLRLRLIGVYNNIDNTAIYTAEDGQKGIVYVFEDVYNNNQIIYIPEEGIDYNSITSKNLEVMYVVKCSTPQEDELFKLMLNSANIEFEKI